MTRDVLFENRDILIFAHSVRVACLVTILLLLFADSAYTQINTYYIML